MNQNEINAFVIEVPSAIIKTHFPLDVDTVRATQIVIIAKSGKFYLDKVSKSKLKALRTA